MRRQAMQKGIAIGDSFIHTASENPVTYADASDSDFLSGGVFCDYQLHFWRSDYAGDGGAGLYYGGEWLPDCPDNSGHCIGRHAGGDVLVIYD